ncbi:hypothetical protein [Lacibacter sp.]|uniref:hypothetical protein n=1 Tax=Lacibacter sp. TaxID=1915409 RepID=UPI002B4B486A|nr:hypothetical protein [Lacibacter sp.]HLP37262.1 hypothetical protein [Lacibacter sp.]
MIVDFNFNKRGTNQVQRAEPFSKQSVGVNRQYFHQQTVVAAFIVEALIGIIGMHGAKLNY